MKTLATPKNQTLYFIIIFFFCFKTYAQNDPFNCVYDAYLFQQNDVYALNLASGNSILVAEDVNSSKINASAYNSADGYLWGYLQQKSKTLIRIGNDFTTTEYQIESIPDEASSSYVGDINLDGLYFFKKNKDVHIVDLNPESDNYLTYQGTFDLSKNIDIHDWAFNSNDNNLYTVEMNTNILYRINTSTNTTTNLGEVPILSNNSYTYGAVYFDLDGNLYISANQTGTVYIVRDTHNIQPGDTLDSNLFAYGPASSSNDGARCPTAPVPTENCSNGTDDDGDGLIDCDDPSCSGVSACPVLTPTTSGNNGGLESNNRLSQRINTRNYKRSKVNYKFNNTKAPKFKRSAVFMNQQNDDVRDFIPVDIIENTETVVSSPEDLIDLTNAEDIFSVDYVNSKNETIASILASKTNNGVYEHTKYICDRLLGAEILSVGSIIINDVSFIKSIIKNPGGETEHVISLSVRNSENNTYTVESHWNLDKYTQNEDFYNFQIWSNTVDNLYTITSEIINNVKNKKPITEYIVSTPPKVYVRKGEYINGSLNLQVVNSYNNTTETIIKGGLRTSETSDTEEVSTTVNFENYNNTIDIDTGSLFDFGFRLEDNKGGTPDDLFVSDGPWGIDDSESLTTVTEYNISKKNEDFNTSGYHIERNLTLKAQTSTYVSAYKAFNPRFRATDISDFNSLEFEAKGTGTLTIVLMKENIDNWDNQYKYNVELNDNLENKTINLNDFDNNTDENIDTSDITMMVFLMRAEKEGITETKEIQLNNIVFTNHETLSKPNIIEKENEEVKIHTNPIQESTIIEFNSTTNSEYSLNVFHLNGKLIQTIKGITQKGINTIQYNKPNVSNGVYLYQLNIINSKTYNGKLIFID